MSFTSGKIGSGVCHCGADVERHGFGDGHSAVEMAPEGMNPILAELRASARAVGTERAVHDQALAIMFGEWRFDSTHEQRQHAKRVLNKLAALAAGEEPTP